jgi:beta-1,2-mannobiose phosphorylase / 1,2-beta-oligomannan phosphorylase
MTGFTVVQSAPLQLIRTSPLAEMYTLSPYVWRGGPGYELLLRAVNHSEIAAEKVARIYYGQSEDGLRFTMGDHIT